MSFKKNIRKESLIFANLESFEKLGITTSGSQEISHVHNLNYGVYISK